MREQVICIFSVVIYLLGLLGLLLSIFNLYEPTLADLSISALWWSITLSPLYISAYFYYVAWYNRRNIFYCRTSFMFASAMLLWFGVELSACCSPSIFRPVVLIALVFFLIFLSYSIYLIFQLHIQRRR